MIGHNRELIAQMENLRRVARFDVRVLICGETGTGKELAARLLHETGARAKAPFVPVNCGAIPVELLENELFGHERAAYTDACEPHHGLIEEADGGTLFLDEVDCLSLRAQVKLLRFLQDSTFRRLGSTRLRRSDTRIVSASNCDLNEALSNGRLRNDLYYRLNVVTILLPPLRERRDDISLLAHRFLHREARRLDLPTRGFTDQALRTLLTYDWPGNVRELENTVERAIILAADERRIDESHIELPGGNVAMPLRKSFREAKAAAVEHFERHYLEQTLALCRGNISGAARVARKNRRAFWELLRKHHIDAHRFAPAAALSSPRRACGPP